MRKVLYVVLGVWCLAVAPELSAAGKKPATAKTAVATATAKTQLGEEYKEVHAFSRMLGFDPHPMLTEYLQDSPKNILGRPMTFTVETEETWKAEPVSLQEIGFQVKVLSQGQLVQTLRVPRKALKTRDAKPGALLGEVSDGDLAVRFLVAEAQVEGGRLVELTYDGRLLAREAGVSTSSPVPVTSEVGQPPEPAKVPVLPPVVATPPVVTETSGVLAPAPESPETPVGLTTGTDIPSVVTRLLEKAYSLPPEQEKVRLSLLRKALAMLGDVQQPGPEVERLVKDLQNRTAGVDAVPANVPASGSAQIELAPVTASTDGVSDEARTLYDQAVRAFALGQEPEARDCLRRAVEKAPGYHQAWVLLGKNALANSKYARAQEAFQQAVSLRGDDVESGVGFFKACYYLGDAEKGLELLKGLVSRNPQALLAREALAEAYYQAGDLESCLIECRQILDRDPKNTRIQDLFARTSQRMK
ncbi:MAG TPA: tetratricopeptide repeat protein [Candidatus Ozemobacteraceae bacterium]|nr:tetratricopeptide repeat protein [Candidatus Ozemobacteraceae bacterium]